MADDPARPAVLAKIAELRAAVAAARREGKRIGLVPTMGALHEGHLSLVRASRSECDLTVVTIFVNPTQFGPSEDFAEYPRALEADLDALADCGEVLVFAPPNDEVYPAGFDSWVEVKGLTETLEGACRPGHFRGVTTIVLKLFNMVAADVAFFGRKDYQQAAVIRRMAEDLNVPTEIRVCPTVREPDGLAMSSRNAYLSPAARGRALVLSKSLSLAEGLVAGGERAAATIIEKMRALVLTAEDARIDYVALVDRDTLEPVARVEGPTMALLAVHIESTRLIDNRLLDPTRFSPASTP